MSRRPDVEENNQENEPPPAPPSNHQFLRLERLSNGKFRLHCQCGYQCSKMPLLSKHVKSMKTGNLFHCDACPKSFATHGGLVGHLKRIHARDVPKLFSCQDCAEVFSSMKEQRAHRKFNHKKLRMTPKYGPEPESNQLKITTWARPTQRN